MRLCGVSPSDGQYAVGNLNGNAIRWSAATGVQILGQGSATGISADGSVVTGFSGGSVFRWTVSSGLVALAPLHDSTRPSVSSDGSTIVYQGSDSKAYRWTIESGALRLPNIDASSAEMIPYGVSGDGSTVVGGAGAIGSYQGCRWGPTGPAVGLGWLNNFHDSAATAISGDGSRVFGYSALNAGLSADAVFWNADGQMTRLYAPDTILRTFGVNVDGTIAVGIGFPNSYVWRAGMGFRNLTDVLLEDFGIDFAADWCQAWGVSADGRTVVGYNSIASGREGFIVHLPWSIPAPGAAAPIALGALATAVRRRR
jgi:uncharacterized membrane protein